MRPPRRRSVRASRSWILRQDSAPRSIPPSRLPTSPSRAWPCPPTDGAFSTPNTIRAAAIFSWLRVFGSPIDRRLHARSRSGDLRQFGLKHSYVLLLFGHHFPAKLVFKPHRDLARQLLEG